MVEKSDKFGKRLAICVMIVFPTKFYINKTIAIMLL